MPKVAFEALRAPGVESRPPLLVPGKLRKHRRRDLRPHVVLMVVGVLKLTLFLPENHSLKGKRGVIKKIKSRVANTFNVSIAECDDHDLWQKAVLGVCQIGPDAAYVEGALRQVVHFIDDMHVAEVGDDQIELLHC